MTELLAGRVWTLRGTPPGVGLDDLETLPGEWLPARVPGTVAEALRDAGSTDLGSIDRTTWWWRTTIDVPDMGTSDPGGSNPPRWELRADGIATVWEVFIDTEVVASGESMFQPVRVSLPLAAGSHDVVLRCAPLASVTTPRRPRAAWRSNLVTDPAYRWHRTAAAGRIPWPGTAPAAGPWRDLRITPLQPWGVTAVRTRLDGSDGHVSIDLAETVPGVGSGLTAEAGATAFLETPTPAGWHEVARADASAGDDTRPPGIRLTVADARRWWPHTHGSPDHYRLTVRAGDTVILRRLVGFRSVAADRSTGGFTLHVNESRLFVRGACWVPPDPLALVGPQAAVERRLASLRSAGLNAVRVTGTWTWQDDHFHDTCTRLGLMVWQDCMLHTLPPVEDEVWLATLDREVRANLFALQGRPSTIVVSGGSETEQQPVLWGLPPSAWRTSALDDVIPAAVADVLPDVVHLTSSPTGGFRPTAVSEGVSHYFGVGAYQRPLTDARYAGVRFAAECLAFGVPPERPFTRRRFGTATRRDDPAWRRGIAKDPTADWDFEQTTAHYVAELFDIDLEGVRTNDPEAALDLLRAGAVASIETTLAEWRRPGSPCDGAFLLSGQDMTPGAGWGLLDSEGGAKCTWYAVARACAPRAVLVTDEGLDGPRIHLVNDRPDVWPGVLSLVANRSGVPGATRGAQDVLVPARSSVSLWAEELLEGFHDLSHAWRFGPPGHDGLTASVTSADGSTTQSAAALGPVLRLHGPRTRSPAPGTADHAPDLSAQLGRDVQGWFVELTATRFVPFVVIDCDDAPPTDNWFHLGWPRRVRLAGGGATEPRGTVRSALGAVDEVGFGPT